MSNQNSTDDVWYLPRHEKKEFVDQKSELKSAGGRPRSTCPLPGKWRMKHGHQGISEVLLQTERQVTISLLARQRFDGDQVRWRSRRTDSCIDLRRSNTSSLDYRLTGRPPTSLLTFPKTQACPQPFALTHNRKTPVTLCDLPLRVIS